MLKTFEIKGHFPEAEEPSFCRQFTIPSVADLAQSAPVAPNGAGDCLEWACPSEKEKIKIKKFRDGE